MKYTTILLSGYSRKRMLGAMTHKCFCGLEKIIKKYNIKTVLECGSGYSSYWFAERVKHLYTVDTNDRWFPQDLNNVTCILTPRNGKSLFKISEIRKQYDLVLIDCYKPLRAKIFNYIKDNIEWKVLCIHDWGRDQKIYDKEYLKQFKRYDYSSLRVACKE